MASKPICHICQQTVRSHVRRQTGSLAVNTQRQWSRATTYNTTRAFSHTSSSRESTQPPPPPRPHKSQDPLASFARTIRQSPALQSTTEPYIAFGGTETLFSHCQQQCNYTIPARLKDPPEPPPRAPTGEDLGEGEGVWFAPSTSSPTSGLGLPVTFNSWAQVMFLHLYALTVRLRAFPPEHARTWHQQLLDHFFYAAEDRMAVWHNMSARGTRNRYLKDLLQQWRGILASYDEGLIGGDAALAAAIWRNLFQARTEVGVEQVALVTAYLRAQLVMLAKLSDEQIAAGELQFGRLGDLRGVVEQKSRSVQ